MEQLREDFERGKRAGRRGEKARLMLDEDAIGTGVSSDRTEEQRNVSAPPVRKNVMNEEITGE